MLKMRGGETPLHVAARWVDLPYLQELIQARALANIQNKDGRTPLHRAAVKGKVECIRELIQAGLM